MAILKDTLIYGSLKILGTVQAGTMPTGGAASKNVDSSLSNTASTNLIQSNAAASYIVNKLNTSLTASNMGCATSEVYKTLGQSNGVINSSKQSISITTSNIDSWASVTVTPNSHATSTTAYGEATTTNYGHTKLIASQGTSNVLAATQNHSHSQYTTTDTKNTAGSTNSTSDMFLIGATSQTANPQTYSNSYIKMKYNDADLGYHLYDNNNCINPLEYAKSMSNSNNKIAITYGNNTDDPVTLPYATSADLHKYFALTKDNTNFNNGNMWYKWVSGDDLRYMYTSGSTTTRANLYAEFADAKNNDIYISIQYAGKNLSANPPAEYADRKLSAFAAFCTGATLGNDTDGLSPDRYISHVHISAMQKIVTGLDYEIIFGQPDTDLSKIYIY